MPHQTSTSGPLSIDVLTSVISEHPRWFTSTLDNSLNKLVFRPYTHQHPASVSPYAHRQGTKRITVKFAGDSFEVMGGRNIEKRYVDPTHAALQETVDTLIEKINPQIDTNQLNRLSGYNKPLPDNVQYEVNKHFDTFYELLSTSKEDLQQLDGIGESRSDAILDPSNPPHNLCEWAAYTICPDCKEEYWSVYPTQDVENTHQGKPPELTRLASLTICPQCNYNDIPTTHLMPPVKFRPENTDKFTPTETDTTEPTDTTPSTSSNTTLDNF